LGQNADGVLFVPETSSHSLADQKVPGLLDVTSRAVFPVLIALFYS
jgi:hypothetical protein